MHIFLKDNIFNIVMHIYKYIYTLIKRGGGASHRSRLKNYKVFKIRQYIKSDSCVCNASYHLTYLHGVFASFLQLFCRGKPV